MAESKDNLVMAGMSGKLGNQLVFRKRGNRTFAAVVPRARTTDPSDSQLSVQERFTLGAKYAKKAITDPATKAIYDAATVLGQSAFNLALADFFTAPEIDAIDASAYTGQPGQVIKAHVTDDFMVKQVTVSIQKPDESLVEQGQAQLGENGIEWEYKTTIANPVIQGNKVIFTAVDMPANVTTRELVL